MQSRFKDVSESEYDIQPPPSGRRKLYPDLTPPFHIETRYENTRAQDHARVHYGHVFNYLPEPYESTLPSMRSPVPQYRDSAGLDTARLIGALSFDHMNTLITSMREAHAGTCEWILGRQEYTIWRARAGFLWIKGKLGTGKTTIMNFAHNHGINNFHEDIIVSHFFGSKGIRLQSSAEGLYRSLLCQVLEQEPQLSASLQRYKLRLDQEHVTWQNEFLKRLLRETILALGKRRLTCYVDAIDECGHSEAQDIINFLEELRNSARKVDTVLCVLISSRHYPQVAIGQCEQIILEEQAEHKTDLSLYIQTKLRLGDSSKACKIRAAIQQRASGVFLWVVLIIQVLNEEKIRGRVHNLTRRLEALPDDLHQLFSSILQNVPCDTSMTLTTFQWLLFTERPLRREELYFALTASESEDAARCWDEDEVSTADMENLIIDSSMGLVEIVKGAQPIVQFIHGSLRDYLLDTGLSILHPATTASLVALSHDRLKQCCHQYVLEIAPGVLCSPTHGLRVSMPQCFRKTNDLRASTVKSHPFLDYALSGMVFHSDQAHLLGLDQEAFIRAFPVQLWARLHNVLVCNPSDRFSLGVCREYIFVLKNAVGLVTVLAQDVPLFADKGWKEPKERYHSLLGAAVANNYNGMARLLLEQGADPNSLVRNSLRCLNVAVMQGNSSMVCLLLDRHIDIQSSAHNSRTMQISPLRLAAELGQTDIVGILLSHPDYSGDWHPDLSHVLEAAIYRRDSTILQLLHGRMGIERRGLVQIIHGAHSQSVLGAEHRLSVPAALQSFRVYYQARHRSGPALFDALHAAFEDRLHSPCRMVHQAPHASLSELWTKLRAPKTSMHLYSTAGIDTIASVVSVLERYASALPTLVRESSLVIGIEHGELHGHHPACRSHALHQRSNNVTPLDMYCL
jgi:ankyrin repeat protein